MTPTGYCARHSIGTNVLFFLNDRNHGRWRNWSKNEPYGEADVSRLDVQWAVSFSAENIAPALLCSKF